MHTVARVTAVAAAAEAGSIHPKHQRPLICAVSGPPSPKLHEALAAAWSQSTLHPTMPLATSKSWLGMLNTALAASCSSSSHQSSQPGCWLLAYTRPAQHNTAQQDAHPMTPCTRTHRAEHNASASHDDACNGLCVKAEANSGTRRCVVSSTTLDRQTQLQGITHTQQKKEKSTASEGLTCLCVAIGPVIHCVLAMHVRDDRHCSRQQQHGGERW